MEGMRPGARVVHAERGPGRVLELRPGRRAHVRLDREPGLPRTFAVDELALEDGAALAHAAPDVEAPRIDEQPRERTPGAPDPSLRQTIEALRLGVVPAENVREYTVAREAALASLEELLAHGGGLRVFLGDYGSGKTHLLEVAEQLGRERGYLTSRVVLDPREVPPSHPRRLYAALVEHLRYPDEAGEELEPLFARLSHSEDHASPWGTRSSRFFTPFLFALQKGDPELCDWMRDYVQGWNMDAADGNARLAKRGWRGERLLTMSDYRTYGRMYIHLLGTVAAWAKDAGYAGLFLLFDEVEYVERLDREQLGFAVEVLKHYAAVTLPREELGFDPSDPEALYRGGQDVHRRIPLFFRGDQPLAVAFALTPLPEIRKLLDGIVRTRAHEVEIAPLSSADRRDLAGKVAWLYARAHPDLELTRALLDELDRRVRDLEAERGESPRSIVQLCVSLLDAERLGKKRLAAVAP